MSGQAKQEGKCPAIAINQVMLFFLQAGHFVKNNLPALCPKQKKFDILLQYPHRYSTFLYLL